MKELDKLKQYKIIIHRWFRLPIVLYVNTFDASIENLNQQIITATNENLFLSIIDYKGIAHIIDRCQITCIKVKEVTNNLKS